MSVPTLSPARLHPDERVMPADLTTADPRRAAVVAEAVSWLLTPFHHAARVKGAGVDCLHLLAEVYERCGLVPHVEPGFYVQDWHLHRDAERFLDGLSRYGRAIEGPPLPGDIALFRCGRVLSHGTIVIAWPTVIHANFVARSVTWGDAEKAPLAGRAVRFFTVFPPFKESSGHR